MTSPTRIGIILIVNKKERRSHMAIVQKNLFSWQEVFSESDISRLELVLSVIPDEGLMEHLEKKRGRGRDDYPIRAVWNSIIAGIVYEHKSIESLRRELLRNGELRDECGFDSILGDKAVPTSRAYSHLLKKILQDKKYIEEMFDKLVEELKKELRDYGRYMGIDSKGVDSFGKPKEGKEKDGRRDTDANWGKKRYKGKRKDGSMWEKVVKWFGYKVHVLADTKYELPIAYKVTRASKNDGLILKELLEKTGDRHAEIVKRTEELSGDRGYDSEENNKLLWDEYSIKPLLDIREMWKDGEKTRALYPERVDNIVYNNKGQIYCHCPVSGKVREMAYMGFEKGRETLKYRCPAGAYGLECEGKERCGNEGKYGRIVRIPLEKDRRIFTPIARSSYAWKRKYKRRTAVERINSRLDVSFGFENHYIRGKAKMEVRMGLALMVMLSMALGSIRNKEEGKMRSLVADRRIKENQLQKAV